MSEQITNEQNKFSEWTNNVGNARSEYFKFLNKTGSSEKFRKRNETIKRWRIEFLTFPAQKPKSSINAFASIDAYAEHLPSSPPMMGVS